MVSVLIPVRLKAVQQLIYRLTLWEHASLLNLLPDYSSEELVLELDQCTHSRMLRLIFLCNIKLPGMLVLNFVETWVAHQNLLFTDVVLVC